MVDDSMIKEKADELFSLILQDNQKYNSICPPDSQLSTQQTKELEEYAQNKGRGFYFSYLSTGEGNGPFTKLKDGSVKYDLINGIGVNLLGHGHPLYIRSHLEAAQYDTINCGNLLSYAPAADLTNKIVDTVKNSKLKHFWFAGSGSFANDNAIKMIWQKTAPKYRLISFKKAFAGRSVAMQNVTHNKDYRVGMPTSLEVDHVSHFNQSDPQNSLNNTLSELDEVVKKSPDQHCAINIELIQGEGGFIYGEREYYVGVFEWAKKNNLYIWVDEVQTFGRTTELFAFQHFKLEEYVDIVTVGKALQACGTLFSEELNPKPGLIAGTFNGSISALISGKKTIDFLTETNFYGTNGRIKELEGLFLNGLDKLSEDYPEIIGYRGGVGTMISFEVFDSSKERTNDFVKNLYQEGIISFIAGKEPTRVRFLLPVCLTNQQVDDIFSVLQKVCQSFKE